MTTIDSDTAGATMLADLERYWHALRGARLLPARTEVDPARIDAALPYSFILERIAPGVGRMRVAGQRIGDYLGMEARGMPLCAMFAAESKERVQGYLEQVFLLPALIELPLISGWGLGRPRLSGRMLLLPLLDTNGAVTRALGAIRTEGGLGRAPRAFEVPEWGAVRIENVSEMAAAQGSALPPLRPSLPRTRITGMEEATVPFAPFRSNLTPPVPQKAVRPYLRLVVSND